MSDINKNIEVKNLIKDRKEKTPINDDRSKAKKFDIDDLHKLSRDEFKREIGERYGFIFGALFYDAESGDLYRFKDVSKTRTYTKYQLYFDIKSDNIDCIFDDEEEEKHYTGWRDDGPTELNYAVSYLKQDRWIQITSEEELRNYEKKVLENFHSLKDFKESHAPQADVTTTALVKVNKEQLLDLEKSYETRQRQIILMRGIIKRRMEALSMVIRDFEEKIEKIRKVIGKIELYFGIHEEIIQIQQGMYAPEDTPVSLRQQILYMDEEVGIVEGGGLDWKHIDDFDNWLLEKNHLDLILPEKKGIVILRVRRKDKRYSECPFENNIMNMENRKTYFLIRNGDNIFRIYADLVIEPRLFPGREEITELQNKSASYFDKRDAEKAVDLYTMHFLVLQGLLDRSEILHPLPHRVDLFNADTWGNAINLIYDDESTALTDGRLSYHDWREQLNEKYNKIGSRVIFCGGYESRDDDRLPWQYHKQHFHPDSGIYNLVKINSAALKDRFDFGIMFNPEDTVFKYKTRFGYYGGWESETRKKSICYGLYTDDSLILNYDNLTVDDLKYYINNRAERRHYLTLIPLFKYAMEYKQKEEDEERAFSELIVKKLRGLATEEELCKRIDEAISWWKFKVIMKRPLTRDDKKSYRMIESRVRNGIKYNKYLSEK